ncbi:hypothetical protein LNO89_09600 [Klebsiella pneumoniae subsp. pneumoniae]|nr:hypothetical protein [Klebsiella pneumoniae subsp. pneumoniae]
MARRNDVNPEITDRFEFFIGGREIGNGFSEAERCRRPGAALPGSGERQSGGR